MIAPGVNPLRHFFDIFIIGSLYLSTYNHRYKYLALFFSFAAILNNPQFGLFAYLALIITLQIQNHYPEKKQSLIKSIFQIVAFLIPAALLYKIASTGSHSADIYFVQGLLGFEWQRKIVFTIFIAIIFSYFSIINSLLKKNSYTTIALFLTLYSQGLLFYYIWGSDNSHLFVIFQIITLAVFSNLKLALEDFSWLKKHSNIILGGFISLAILFYIPSVAVFYKAKFSFDRVFTTHKIYNWNLPTARFISTINPDYFIDSIELIKSHADNNKIFIISKYDNFLPFLAKKYSAMPYFDVPWYTISTKDIQACIEAIKENKPKYLFVDTDINRSYEPDVISSSANQGFLKMGEHEESVLRLVRLKALKQIFLAVKSDYKPVKSAQLITVYEKIN